MRRDWYVELRGLARISEAFFRLDMLEEISYPLSATFRYLGLLLPVVIQFFVAALIDRPENVGGDYFTFAVIGLAVSAAIQETLGRLGRRLQQVQNRGVFESLLIEPVPWSFMPIAMNIWHWLAAAVAAALALLTGAALGAEFDLSGLLPFSLIVGLGMLAGLSIGVLSGAVLVITKRSSPLITVYGLAASLVGGAVFPVALLPDWLKVFSFLVPHAYAIGAARTALMVEAPTSVFGTTEAVIGLAVFDVLALPLSILAFNRALRLARRRGLLGTY